MIECTRTWFALAEGLYVLLALAFLFGTGAALGVAPYLPARLRKFLGY